MEVEDIYALTPTHCKLNTRLRGSTVSLSYLSPIVEKNSQDSVFTERNRKTRFYPPPHPTPTSLLKDILVDVRSDQEDRDVLQRSHGPHLDSPLLRHSPVPSTALSLWFQQQSLPNQPFLHGHPPYPPSPPPVDRYHPSSLLSATRSDGIDLGEKGGE